MCNILGPDGFEGKYKIIAINSGIYELDDLDPDDYRIYEYDKLSHITSSVSEIFGGKYDIYLKMYGKKVSKLQRKLGHFNVVDLKDENDVSELLRIVDEQKNRTLITPLD